MLIFDGLIVAVVVLGFWQGQRSGLAEQIAGIVTLVVGFGLATSISRLEPVAGAVRRLFDVSEVVSIVIAWAAIYLVVAILLTLIVRQYKERLEEAKVEWLDKNVGGVFGALKSFLFCTALMLFVAGVSDRARGAILSTYSGRAMAIAATEIHGLLPEPWHQRLAEYLHNLEPRDGPTPAPAPIQGGPAAIAGEPTPQASQNAPLAPPSGATDLGGPAPVPPEPPPERRVYRDPPPAAPPRAPAPTPSPPPEPVPDKGSTWDDEHGPGEPEPQPTWPPRERQPR